MRIFDELNIETQSTCNRTCQTCLRNSYPDRSAVAGHFERRQMPADLVRDLLAQAAALGFRGRVCLQHFNEPLQDERIAEFGRYAKGLGVFAEVYINTNGDYLTRQLAEELDGAFDRLHVALYGGDKFGRAARYADWFRRSRLTFTAGEHVVTHHSPYDNLHAAIANCVADPCERECQMRCIINHAGRMALCCEDIATGFELGAAQSDSLEQLWFGPRHREILQTLAVPGGRNAYDYCRTCPRPNTPHWSVLP